MEHRINKVDVEIIQKVIDYTKEELVHSMRETGKQNPDLSNRKNSKEEFVRNRKKKTITVDAYRDKGEIIVNATKDEVNQSGKYIDLKR